MVRPVVKRFRLFGGMKGKSVEINGHKFVNGECTVQGSTETIVFIARYLAHWRAYAEGSPQYAAELGKETDGQRDVSPASTSGSAAAVLGEVRPAGQEPAAAQAPGPSGDGAADPGTSGDDAAGTGQANAGVGPTGEVDEKLARAVKRLDPNMDAQWTAEGLPRLSAVEDAYGRAGVTRRDVEAAAPGWTRDAAKKELADLIG